MKPNGFVEAASSTSQTSIPIRSNTILSSLTSAMFTARKMFSTSLVASACARCRPAPSSRWPGRRRPGQGRRSSRPRRRRPWGSWRSRTSRCPGPPARERRRGRSPRRTCRPVLLEDSAHELVRRARIRRRLEDDELAAPQARADLARRADDVAHVGLALRRQRRRNADEDHVRLAEPGEIGRRAEAARRSTARATRSGSRCWMYMRPWRQRVDLRPVDVEPEHPDSSAPRTSGPAAGRRTRGR